ncbi:hypothetical protein [Burkholderia multivorans]|uniref:hypothetical protein n=1 Tax=Burkholderia multivorans TaxID=87883 RepID=UPI00158C2DFF|nr:hypothetical protein [Burkholderia multivorans]
MRDGEPAVEAGVWVVSDFDSTPGTDAPLFPDDYVASPSSRPFEPLFPDDYVAPPSSRPFEPLFPVDDGPAADWISRAIQGIQRMHRDETERAAVADRLF